MKQKCFRFSVGYGLAIYWAVFVISCSSKPTFVPEIGGEGAKASRDGIVYSIPPKNPVLKMKLISMVIPNKSTLHVRMFFLRKGAPSGEYLDPKELTITLPDSSESIYPAHVHASAVGKPHIKLADVQKQTVELLYSVPKGGHEYPYINLNWKVHYRQDGIEKTMAETERFDYVAKNDPQMGVGRYNGYEDIPYVGWSDFPDEWITPGWLWW